MRKAELAYSLQINKTGSRRANYFGQLRRAIHDHVLVKGRMFESDKDRERRVHGQDDGRLIVGGMDSVDGVCKAQVYTG